MSTLDYLLAPIYTALCLAYGIWMFCVDSDAGKLITACLAVIVCIMWIKFIGLYIQYKK